MFSTHSGDRFVNAKIVMGNEQLRHRVGASLVRDSKTGARYLKLVNALPSTLDIRVQGLTLPATVECEQFTGAIDDQKAKTEIIKTGEPTKLPPYSFRVIKL